MPIEPEKRIRVGKGILIFLILLYAGLSLLDCTQAIGTNWTDVSEQGPEQLGPCHNNFSWVLIFGAAVQIFLIVLNRFKLQAVCAFIVATPGMMIPLKVGVSKLLSEIIYVMPGNTPEKLRMLPMGWLVFTLAIFLIAGSIFAAVWFSKQKTLIVIEEQNPAQMEESEV